MALRSIHVMQGDPRGHGGRLPGRAHLQLHEPGQHRRPGGDATTPTSRSCRSARGRSSTPRSIARGRRARPGAARRRERRAQPRVLERAPHLRRRRTSLPLLRGGVGAPRATTRRSTAADAPDAAPRDASWARCPSGYFQYYYFERRGPRASCRPSRRRAPRTSSAGCPTTGSTTSEQARQRRARARPGPLARRHPRARAGDRLHGRRLQRPRRDAAGERAEPRLGARASPTRSSSRRSGRCDAAAASTRCRCRACPTHLRGLVEALGEYQQAAADAAWSGDAARRRARARRASAGALARPRRAAVRRDGGRAHRAHLPARARCPRVAAGQRSAAPLAGSNRCTASGVDGELDRLAGREAPPPLDAAR